jgi:hypothetical protein
MDPTSLQTQFTRQCVDASFGYAKAWLAMYAEVSETMLTAYSDLARASMPGNGTPAQSADVWYTPARPARTAFVSSSSPVPAADVNPFTMWFSFVTGQAQRNALAANPFLAFWTMMPGSTNPASWPMAYGMMNCGVPRAVAWPAAEANTAAIDAMNTATDAMRAPFSSYQSTGGYATAQVWAPENMMRMVGALPFGAAAFFPWLTKTPVG